MLHQAVNCLNCLLRWQVVAEGNFLPQSIFGRAPGWFKIHRHDLPDWLGTTGLPSLTKVISDPGMKLVRIVLHCTIQLTVLMGVIVKIPILPKRKLLFREAKPLVPFYRSRFFPTPLSFLPAPMYILMWYTSVGHAQGSLISYRRKSCSSQQLSEAIFP